MSATRSGSSTVEGVVEASGGADSHAARKIHVESLAPHTAAAPVASHLLRRHPRNRPVLHVGVDAATTGDDPAVWASALADALAGAGRRVLLVTRNGHDGQPGLAEVSSGQLDLDDALAVDPIMRVSRLGPGGGLSDEGAAVGRLLRGHLHATDAVVVELPPVDTDATRSLARTLGCVVTVDGDGRGTPGAHLPSGCEVVVVTDGVGVRPDAAWNRGAAATDAEPGDAAAPDAPLDPAPPRPVLTAGIPLAPPRPGDGRAPPGSDDAALTVARSDVWGREEHRPATEGDALGDARSDRLWDREDAARRQQAADVTLNLDEHEIWEEPVERPANWRC